MNDSEQLTDAIRGCHIAGPVSEADIVAAEHEMDVKFPPSYRDFLKRFGAVSGFGFEIAGLFKHSNPDETPEWVNVILFSKQLRRGAHDDILSRYIPVADDGCECIFYIDTQATQYQGEPPVVALGPGYDSVIVADSFADFVVKASKRALSF